MISIAFANPEFHEGRNVTCRRPSLKYTQGLRVDSPVTLMDLDGNPVGEGWVCMVAMYDNVLAIPEDVLANEHDPGCRNSEGLLAELQRVYGSYSEHERVLVVGFDIRK